MVLYALDKSRSGVPVGKVAVRWCTGGRRGQDGRVLEDVWIRVAQKRSSAQRMARRGIECMIDAEKRANDRE